MNTSHPIKPVFCGGIVSILSWVTTYLYGSWVPAICCRKGGVSMCGGGGVVGELRQWEPSYPAILTIMAVDPKVLFKCLDGSLAESVSLRVVCSG